MNPDGNTHIQSARQAIDADRYTIYRFYQNGGKEVIETGLTLTQAKHHCQDPETSSSTATDPEIDERGEWFDGYQKERS